MDLSSLQMPPSQSSAKEVNEAKFDECMQSLDWNQDKWLAASLHIGMKSAACPPFKTGMTKQTFCLQMSKGLWQEHDLPATNAFCIDKSIPKPSIKQMLQATTGTLHNIVQAYTMCIFIWLSRKCFLLGQWAWEWGAPLALPRAYCARAPLAVGCFVIMFLGGGDIQNIPTWVADSEK